MRIAFYAPLKSPDHPNPSGDRRMARLIMQALRHAGHDVHLASELRSFDGVGDSDYQHVVREQAAREAASILSGADARPDPGSIDAWFTYHVYYKAPDWIGPEVAQALDIPYFTAELSYAEKRADGPWALNHQGVRRSLEAGSRHFCFTGTDRVAIERFLGGPDRIVALPPFLEDVEEVPPSKCRSARVQLCDDTGWSERTPVLLVVAMMRPGDKAESYRLLAQAMEELLDLEWGIVIVGDGDARSEVEGRFASIPAERVHWAGRVEVDELWRFYTASDLYVWPAHNEAYGMAFLEAQSYGLPVVAQATRGVPDVVKTGWTGQLTPEGSMADFVLALRKMIGDAELRDAMGKAARSFVAEERTIAAAARILDDTIRKADD